MKKTKRTKKVSENRAYIDLLAEGAAKDFLDNSESVIEHISHMSGTEAVYFALRVMENFGAANPHLCKAFANKIAEMV